MSSNAYSDKTIDEGRGQDRQQKQQHGLPLSADEQEYTTTSGSRSSRLANTTALIDKIEYSKKFQLNFQMYDWLQNNITESRRSWHLETLFGLLINCEDELVASGVEPGFLDSSDSTTAGASINNLVVPEHTDQTGSFKSSQSRRQRFNKGNSVKLKGRPTYYCSKEHEQEQEQHLSSELLILPTVLKSFDVHMNTSTDASKYPNKYRRIDYAARDIQQTEKYVLNKFQDWCATTRMKEDGSLVPALSKTPDSTPQKFKVCTLLYNQCSINALATWAARSPRQEQVVGQDNVTQHLLSTRTTNTKAQESQEQSSFKSKLFYCPVPSTSTFRRCSICHLFGHLEVECREVPHESISQRSCQLEIASHLRIQTTLQNFASAEEIEENLIPSEQVSLSSNRKSNLKSKSDVYSADQNKFSSSPWMMIKTTRREEVVGEEAKKPSDLTNGDAVIIQEQGSSNNRQEPENVRHGSNFIHGDDDVFVPNCTTCKICHSGFRYEDILLCDGCNMLFHRQCLNPPLESIPDGEWFCEECDPYDSDVSSYIDIEGLDGFVIEQRKRSTAESESCDIDIPMRVGFDSNDWNAVMCVATTNKNKILSAQNENVFSNDYDNTIDLSTRYDNNHESMKFVEGEVCWTKHSVYEEFWPAIVVEILNPHQAASEILYKVKLIRDFGENVVNGKSLIPFMTNSLLEIYKKKRYYRTFTPQKVLSMYEALDNAVEEVLHELGYCTIDSALESLRETKIRESIDSVTKKIPMKTIKKNKRNVEKKKQKKRHEKNRNHQPKQLRPTEWNNAEMSVEDGFAIFARSLKDDTRNKNEQQAGFSNLEHEPSRSSACNGDNEINVIQGSRKLVVENLLGSIVAYPIVNLQNDNISNVESTCITKWNFGAICDISKARDGKILIRHLPELYDTFFTSKKKSILESTGSGMNDKFTNEIEIHCCSIGSSLWIPIDKVVLIKEGRQTLQSRRFFSTAIKNELLNEMNRTKRKLNDEAIKREENMVEIASLNSDTSMKENKSQNVDNTSNYKSTLHLPSQHDDVTETYKTTDFTAISNSKAGLISNVDDEISNNLSSRKTSKFIEKTRASSSPSLQQQISEDLDRIRNISEYKDNDEDIDSFLTLPDESTIDTERNKDETNSDSESNDKSTIITKKKRRSHTPPSCNLEAEQQKKKESIKQSVITREIETRRKTSSSHSTGRPKRMHSPSPQQRGVTQASIPSAKSENKETTSGSRTKTTKKKRKTSPSYSADVLSPGSVLKKLDAKQNLDDGGEEIFFAEEILDERVRQPGNVKEYFIKWKDYPLEACTWEPEQSFLHSNFLRTYHAHKKLIELRATKEATNEKTPTARMIRILEYGLEMMAAHPEDEASSSKRKRKICPFCLFRSDSHASHGGHMRQHTNEPNFKMIKEVKDFIVEAWYEQELGLNEKTKR